MKKNEIVLSEQELHDFIRESVSRVLVNEGFWSKINPWSKENKLNRQYDNLQWQTDNADKIYNVQRIKEIQSTMEGVRYAVQNLQWAQTQAGENYDMVASQIHPIVANLQRVYQNLRMQLRDFKSVNRNPDLETEVDDNRAYKANGMYDEYDDAGNLTGTNRKAI